MGIRAPGSGQGLGHGDSPAQAWRQGDLPPQAQAVLDQDALLASPQPPLGLFPCWLFDDPSSCQVGYAGGPGQRDGLCHTAVLGCAQPGTLMHPQPWPLGRPVESVPGLISARGVGGDPLPSSGPPPPASSLILGL